MVVPDVKRRGPRILRYGGIEVSEADDGYRSAAGQLTGTRGVSGAPLLIEQNGKWFVMGVDVLAQYGAAEG
jgi:hypothetical protein